MVLGCVLSQTTRQFAPKTWESFPYHRAEIFDHDLRTPQKLCQGCANSGACYRDPSPAGAGSGFQKGYRDPSPAGAGFGISERGHDPENTTAVIVHEIEFAGLILPKGARDFAGCGEQGSGESVGRGLCQSPDFSRAEISKNIRSL